MFIEDKVTEIIVRKMILVKNLHLNRKNIWLKLKKANIVTSPIV